MNENYQATAKKTAVFTAKIHFKVDFLVHLE